MNSELKLLAETTDKLFGEWNDLADAWRTLEETGLTRIGISEDLGGSGGDAEQAAAVLRSAAYHGVAAPIAETLWLAGPLLAAARLPIPDGPLTAATADLRELHCRPSDDGRGWELDGTVRRVPWARGATRVVLVIGDRICSLDPQVCTIRPGANLAGEPRDDGRAALRPLDRERFRHRHSVRGRSATGQQRCTGQRLLHVQGWCLRWEWWARAGLLRRCQ